MDKKAVELSVNVIIIAAISLIVLVLLAFLVLKSGIGISQGTQCEQLGGTCSQTKDCGDYARYDITKVCSKEQAEAGYEYCCMPLGG